ncbi:CBS domain-containing protein [Rhodoblastus sp.]|uniref:CBS domain-containing protein n=1 Tax=Rhodoblastus sp. TaxID=1962975 RepID=UPI00263267B4|nr:CBS domain-containing protein [Rhodoblastus sp.]
MLDIARAIENKHAVDAMTSPVVTVTPDVSARAAAEEMLRLHVSGLPVVDRDGRPLGVVSESDFRFADAATRQRQRDAWVAILAEGQDIAADYLEALERSGETVRQVMSKPALAVDQDASLTDVADLMTAHRVKRILVTRQDKLVGVITRADLLRFFTQPEKRSNAPVTAETFEAACQDIRLGLAAPRPPAPPARSPAPPVPEGAVTAASLKELVKTFERGKSKLHDDAQRQAREKRDDAVRRLLGEKFTDGELAHLLILAREAAMRGESGVPALVFPAALCNDGGRMINLPDPDWPRSLCGKAADFYRRWDKELRPLGFALSARIATFPDGFPGDAELSLVWGR